MRYAYPLGDARYLEDNIQLYFSHRIEDTPNRLYHDTFVEYHYFGHASSLTPPCAVYQNLKSDVIYLSFD